MKSNQVPLEERKHYSHLMVLQSARGYYIGSLWHDPDNANESGPGTRDSQYFASPEEAQAALDSGEFCRFVD
jgi:hypothetical protein